MSVLLSLVLASTSSVGEVHKFDAYRHLSDPVMLGRNVAVAAVQEGSVVALNEAGSSVWTADLSKAIGGKVANLRITSANGKWLYFQGSMAGPSTVVGRVDADGAVAWHKKFSGMPNAVFSATTDADLVCLLGSNKIARFNPSGTLEWGRPLRRLVAHAVYGDSEGTYLAAATGGNSEGDLQVMKLDGNGAMVWARMAGHVDRAIGRADNKGHWLVDSSTLDTYVSCIDMRTAKVLWQRNLPGKDLTLLTGVRNSKGDVLVSTTLRGGDAKLWCLDKTGRQLWVEPLSPGAEGARALHLDEDRTGYFFAGSNQDSAYGQLGHFGRNGSSRWVKDVRISGGRAFMRRANRVELYGLIEQAPNIGAAARAWYIER